MGERKARDQINETGSKKQKTQTKVRYVHQTISHFYFCGIFILILIIGRIYLKHVHDISIRKVSIIWYQSDRRNE